MPGAPWRYCLPPRRQRGVAHQEGSAMAVLKQLHAAPSVPIQIPGIEGYELICTEAGRTNEGLTGSVAPKNGHITGDALRVCWPNPESCSSVRAHLAEQLTKATRVEVADTDFETPLRGLYEAVESMLREEKRGDETQAARIVQLAQAWDLFHTPDGVAYVTFPGDPGEQQTWPLRSRVMRDRLEQVYYTTHGGVPGAQAVQDAIGVLAGKARFAGAERSVFLRLAEHEGVIYLDLCDPAWRVVAISAQGWRVIAGRDAPVRFRRTQGMLPLPEPRKGGCVATLRKFLNVANNDEQA